MKQIINQFRTNLNKHNKGWKLAWGVTAVACVILSLKASLYSNLVMLGCWLFWLPYIYFDWENK
ncbi:hypothetical protein OAK65_03730 [Synechococcus sp. AH-551-N17]|nr:hypothetical protein [Synechococcus sp. AH-551-N17]